MTNDERNEKKKKKNPIPLNELSFENLISQT